jgi:hypothetical protein
MEGGDAEPDSWALAPADARWTAVRSDVEHTPREWGELLRGDALLRLKDTRGKYWPNRLESPNTFVYCYPTIGRRHWEQDLLRRLHARVRSGKRLWVHLFSTPGSRDEYYGEWVVSELRPGARQGASELVLLRLREQSALYGLRYAMHKGGAAEEEGMGEAYRSRNERLHARLLAAEFAAADGWTVRFEPETLLDVHEPSVVDGARRADITRSYTCDFVALRGAQRLCIESKPCEEHVTAEALHKCRVLRDRTLTRVVVMAGAHAPRWLDVGAVDAPPEAAVWHADAAALKAALGL